MNATEIEFNLKLIQAAIDLPVVTLDIEQVINKLSSLQSLSGLSAEVLRYTKANVLAKQMPALVKWKGAGIPPTALKAFVEADMANEVVLHLYAVTLNDTIRHAQDALRTIISMRKSEMENSV